MAGTIEIEGLGDVETVLPPDVEGERSSSGDYCGVCGIALHYGGRGKHPKYCAEHKSGSVSKTAGTARRSNAKAANESEWVTFNLYLLIGATYLLAKFLAGGQGLFLRKPDELTEGEFDRTTSYLAMNDEEARPIAKLLAQRMVGTTLNKKYGKHIVRALEYEEIGTALWAYGERVGPAIKYRINAPHAPRAPKAKTAPKPVPVKEVPQERKVQTNGATRPLSNREAAAILRQQHAAEQQGIA